MYHPLQVVLVERARQQHLDKTPPEATELSLCDVSPNEYRLREVRMDRVGDEHSVDYHETARSGFHASSETFTVISFRALLAASRPPICCSPSLTSLRNHSVKDASPAGTWVKEPYIIGTSNI